MLALLVTGCTFPTASERLVCAVDGDCEDGRVCEQGFCVTGQRDAAVDPDANVVVDTPPDADPFLAIAAQCEAVGYAFVPGPDGYYRAVTGNQRTWVNAQADCKDDVLDATHLIVLTTTAEVTYMDALLGNDAWIGLSDRVTEGTFVTVTGEPDDQRPFRPGEPNNGNGNEDCVVMAGGGGLDDRPCGNTHRYLCECDGQPSTP